jgi:hypothetical protein
MSGSRSEVLTGGPDEGGGPLLVARRARPPWTIAVVAGLAGVLVGVVGTHLFGGADDSTTNAAPRPTASASAEAGVVVPEVVDAQTLPGTGGMEVVAEAVNGASTPGALRYDYRLDGAVWLAPDGTVRGGRPVCTSGAGGGVDDPQYLQVAVVHARAVEGGPNADRVVWYRCASQVGG